MVSLKRFSAFLADKEWNTAGGVRCVCYVIFVSRAHFLFRINDIVVVSIWVSLLYAKVDSDSDKATYLYYFKPKIDTAKALVI